jgi:hypothetical protein
MHMIESLPANGTPPLGVFRETLWPTRTHGTGGLWSGEALRSPELKVHQIVFPILVGLLNDIQQTSFWQYRRPYGVSPMEMVPMNVGMKFKIMKGACKFEDFSWEINKIPMLQQRISTMMGLSPAAREAVDAGSILLKTVQLDAIYCKLIPKFAQLTIVDLY